VNNGSTCLVETVEVFGVTDLANHCNHVTDNKTDKETDFMDSVETDTKNDARDGLTAMTARDTDIT